MKDWKAVELRRGAEAWSREERSWFWEISREKGREGDQTA